MLAHRRGQLQLVYAIFATSGSGYTGSDLTQACTLIFYFSICEDAWVGIPFFFRCGFLMKCAATTTIAAVVTAATTIG